MKLTPKQQKFVDAYDGNLQEAAQKAGLRYDYCRRLYTKSHIVDAIRTRREQEPSANIADRRQRQEFWTEVMRDSGADMKDRLKASDLLGKSEADFLERRYEESEQHIEITWADGEND